LDLREELIELVQQITDLRLANLEDDEAIHKGLEEKDLQALRDDVQYY
jgi:hypothetical protein